MLSRTPNVSIMTGRHFTNSNNSIGFLFKVDDKVVVPNFHNLHPVEGKSVHTYLRVSRVQLPLS